MKLFTSVENAGMVLHTDIYEIYSHFEGLTVCTLLSFRRLNLEVIEWIGDL